MPHARPAYGVPAEWLKEVRDADEDGLLALTGYLPAEAAEAVLELATGGTPYVSKAEPTPTGTVPDPFTHPDAQRRFRVVTSVEELERAMDAPWDKWAVFLHPEQRQLVTRDFNGPARVAGSAGTGKTVVALHRAVHLARTMPESRILLATFVAIPSPCSTGHHLRFAPFLRTPMRAGPSVTGCGLSRTMASRLTRSVCS